MDGDRRQPQIAAVAALPFQNGGEIEVDVAGRGERFDFIGLAEEHLRFAAEEFAQGFQRRGSVLAAPGRLIGPGIVGADRDQLCALTEHADALDLFFLQRQNAVVLEQHDGFARRFERQRFMGRAAHEGVRRFAVGEGPLKQAEAELCGQHVQHVSVQLPLGQLAFFHRFLHRGKRVKRQNDVQPCFERFRCGLRVGIHQPVGGAQTLHAPVIGHHEAPKAPVAAQDVGQQAPVRAAGHALPAVVGRHHGPRAGVKAGFERRQDRFAHGALARFGIVGIAAAEAVVVGKMLRCGNHAVFCKAAAHGSAHVACQPDVFAEGFHRAAPAAVARQVDHRRKHLPHADRGALLANGVRHAFRKRGIERRRQTDRLREVRAHAPLGAVQRFAVFNRRNTVRLRLDAGFHVFVDLCRHLGGRGRGLALLVHEMPRVAVAAAERIAAGVVIAVHIKIHVGRHLPDLFVECQLAQQRRRARFG